MEVSPLKTSVANLVEENTTMGEVRGNAPDPELQPPETPRTPTQDLTIRPRPVLPALRTQAGMLLVREVTTRNWANQVESDNTKLMNIEQADVEPG